MEHSRVKITELAYILDLSEEMVRRHSRAGRFIRDADKKFEVRQAVQAYFEMQHDSQLEPGLTEERTRLTKYQADKTYLELQEKRRELWPVRICLMYFSEVVKSAQQELLSLKNEVKMEYPDIEDKVLIYLDAKIREALERAAHRGAPPDLAKAVNDWNTGDNDSADDDNI
ncbi:MAG: hypothetical protein JXA20_17920 [Spirochaetes bacterium]|nr:hypothetical protein [Spirochaetota bacterium]